MRLVREAMERRADRQELEIIRQEAEQEIADRKLTGSDKEGKPGKIIEGRRTR